MVAVPEALRRGALTPDLPGSCSWFLTRAVTAPVAALAIAFLLPRFSKASASSFTNARGWAGIGDMRGRLEHRIWQHDPAIDAPARYRRACAYDASVPSPIDGS